MRVYGNCGRQCLGLEWKSRAEWHRSPTPREAFAFRISLQEEAMEGASSCVLTWAGLSCFSKGFLLWKQARVLWRNHFIHNILETLMYTVPFGYAPFCRNLVFRYTWGGATTAMLLETKCLPLQSHTIKNNGRAFLQENGNALYFVSLLEMCLACYF